MRTPLVILAIAAAAAIGLAAPSAIAVNQGVRATDGDTWSPAKSAVKPGESVTFTNPTDGDHNVVWNDGSTPLPGPESVPSRQWPAAGVARTFTKPGKYRYYCKLHGDSQVDFGMVGYVYVNSVGLVPPALSSVSASGKRTKATLKLRSSRAGKVKATFLRKSGRKFVRKSSTTFSVRSGRTTKSVVRAFSKGSWRVELVVTDANKLVSDKRTASFKVS